MVLFFIAAALTASAIAQKTAIVSAPTTDGLVCSRFDWFADANTPKAGIRVPITIAGKQYSYQLDTGADVVIAYGHGEREGWVKKSDFTLVNQIQFAGMTLPSIPLFRMESVSDADVQGSVGLDMLIGCSFVIDFPKRKVCLLNRADMPDSLSRAATWVPGYLGTC